MGRLKVRSIVKADGDMWDGRENGGTGCVSNGKRMAGGEIRHARRQGGDGWKAMVDENEEGNRSGEPGDVVDV